MKVEITPKEKESLKFSDLNIGDVFRPMGENASDIYYMKIADDGAFNVYNPHITKFFISTDSVKRYKAKLIIQGE